jgi:mediator of RNA polymerase II transcription subunit 15
MIARMDRDEDKKKELNKMKNLLDILSNPSRRLPMDTLLKCEQVLEKMELMVKPMDSSVSNLPFAQLGKDQNICQPLLDAISNNIKSPLINHTLQRTFGPAVAALHGTSYRSPSPPPKKHRGVEEDHQGTDIPDVLQGEIARLDQRFKVNLDPLQHSGAKTIHLICQLDDRNLPCVPPITVTVPENYPQQPPQCDTSSDEYDSTPFLQCIQRALLSRLMMMPDKFSITSLLDTWEMSVRQACAPVAIVSSTT